MAIKQVCISQDNSTGLWKVLVTNVYDEEVEIYFVDPDDAQTLSDLLVKATNMLLLS